MKENQGRGSVPFISSQFNVSPLKPCRKDKISLKTYDGTFFGISEIPQACIFNLSGK